MFRGCALAVLSCLSMLPLCASSAVAPGDVVTAFHGVLLNNMKHGASLGCSGRRASLTSAIDADFDVAYISQRILRRHWGALSADQQQQFLAAFRELVIVTYASQFSRFGGESFATLDAKDLPGGDTLVHTKLTTGSGTTVALDYALHPESDADHPWRVINIVADGVSDLAVKSTQYDKLFQDGGFDQLLSWITEQKKKTLAECP